MESSNIFSFFGLKTAALSVFNIFLLFREGLTPVLRLHVTRSCRCGEVSLCFEFQVSGAVDVGSFRTPGGIASVT